MYELVQISENDYYIESPAKIGLVKLNDEDIVLIDSGNDKNAGRKIKKILDENGWNLKAIYNTHSNADHIGGNRYLQNNTGCKIFSPGIEKDFTVNPILEPAFLYGGFPPKDLRHKFTMAQSSDAQYLTKDNIPDGFEIIDLPGHFFEMVGFRTPDNNIFLADCLTSPQILDKYRISFLYDVESYLKTLEKIKKLEANKFIPAHSAATDNVKELADLNIKKIKEIGDDIVELCAEGITFEDLLAKLFNKYELTMNFEQNALVGSTVRSFLTWLYNQNLIKPEFSENKLYWRKV